MKTILVIDDDKQVCTMFSMALRKHGYHVLEADSGATGLAMARQHLPDLILSDIHMPGGDGSSLLRDIRRDPELRSKQIVLMTGRPDLVTPRKGMEEGADDFLVKPVSLEALLNCVKARFGRASISWRVEDPTLEQLRSSLPPNLPHECFTPLAGMIGLIEILRGEDSGLTPEELKDIYNDLYQSSLRLHRTLRNYLLLVDSQNAAPEPVPPLLAPRDVKASIETGITEALRLNQREDDLTIRINPCSIAIKPGDLSHVIEELIDNAFKFSRQGTPVNLELGADGQLVVADEGRGLTAEQIAHIGAFHQFDRKKYEQQGLGLGLVLIQRIVAHCKADFSIESDPGKGTRVRIAFPTVKA
jgi:signal transduction histidine kinase